MNKIEALLHPVRLRIATTLLAGRHLTAQQIGRLLPDEPPASLYRHLHRLVAADIVQVVASHPVRGAVEKVYGMAEQSALLRDEDLAALSREELVTYFTTFIAGQISILQHAMESASTVAATDIRYVQEVVRLDAEEFARFLAERNAWLHRLRALPPRPGRTQRLISITAIPMLEPDPESPTEK